jgi:hypothetical protein
MIKGLLSPTFLIILFAIAAVPGFGQRGFEIRGTEFYLDNERFVYNGISFFNAIYNPAFNENDSIRDWWLKKFRKYGVNVIRVWGQWDNGRGFADGCGTCTLYDIDGNLIGGHVAMLKNIAKGAELNRMVVEFVLFSRESWEENIRLSKDAYIKAARALAGELRPYRNLTFQVWNEFDLHIPEIYRAIKAADPQRLVTNSPGYAGILGEKEHNDLLDFLTPHTTRDGDHWNKAPEELASLKEVYKKPVVDDEPARTGTIKYGGPKGENHPHDFIIHIYNVWKTGCPVIYHHDMFQTGYGTPAVPPSGIPDPEFSDFHRQVLEFLKLYGRY